MHHAANLPEREEQPPVRRGVGGGLEFALDDPAVEVDQHHLRRPQLRVVDAAGFDRENPARPIERRGVAEGEVDQTVPRQGEVGFVGFAFEFGEHGGKPSKRESEACVHVGSALEPTRESQIRLIFFWDPLAPQPHDPDVKALLRLAVVWNVPVACNRATADFLISSPLLSTAYERTVPDYAAHLQRPTNLKPAPTVPAPA